MPEVVTRVLKYAPGRSKVSSRYLRYARGCLGMPEVFTRLLKYARGRPKVSSRCLTYARGG
jgi:hypothetical protein